jgi:putative hydrolase of the HAD superfamily
MDSSPVLRAVIFDVDDTLVNFTRANEAGFRRYLLDVAPDLGTSEIDAAECAWNEIGGLHFADYLAGRISFQEQRRRRVRQFLEHCGLLTGAADGAEGTDSWFAGYLAHCDAVLVAFDDVRPALDMLRAAGLRIGALSNNTHLNQDRRLRLVGLRADFDALICCDDVGGVAKPDSRIFHAGCAALGVQAGEAAYVGDDLEVDGRGAALAGLSAYWLNRRTDAVDHQIPTVRDLVEFASDAIG